MIRNPYENPLYRGPECDGLSPDDAFDLAKQLRIAARNKRISERLYNQRADGASVYWGVALSIAAIAAGLALAMEFVH